MMSLYRIKQFWWSLTSKINEEDHKYLKLHLSEDEIKLFNRLAICEQKHCINVAKDVEQICFNKKLNCDRLIKAALLHDVGKIDRKLNVIDKSILVILDCLSKGKIRKLNKFKKIDVYYNHAIKGTNILRRYGYDNRLLYLIENHHNKNIKGDLELDMLKLCDNNN